MNRSLLFLTALLTFSPLAALAQEVPATEFSELAAIITGPEEVKVGRTIVLDGSASRGLNDDSEYRWYLGDSAVAISRSVEAVYTPDKSGIVRMRLEITSTVNGKRITESTVRNITVYERKIILLAGSEVPEEKLNLHLQAAAEAGVYLRVLQPEESAIPIGTEESMFTIISEESDTFNGAEAIVLWMKDVKGLQALMRAVEGNEDTFEFIHNQTIILISDRSITTLARTSAGPYTVIRPDQILVTRKEALNPLISAVNIESFMEDLTQRDIDYIVVDESSTGIRPWNVLSSLVNYMLTHGVSSQTVTLLLLLPLIATILAFFKQVIGITTFGLYTPSIVALSFLALGSGVGMLFLLFILITGYATRSFMKRWRLLYIPKVAIILTVVSITVLILLSIGAYFDITLSGDTIFVLLIMSTLAESFLNVKMEQGWKSALFGIGETVFAALACVYIVSLPFLRSVILAYPELILITIVINIFLGRWTGLRLVEYFRFQEVFKHMQEE
ncbi:MAG: 7TM domain-containing protein [Candidatus Peribacteraceae bacterium]|nr:7TM domain-containing protein [Candidatus Peribacteraceae bacterium]MDP7476915.1 7TM domain-containing protein [Candidatus Peribacteraceae bacterium]